MTTIWLLQLEKVEKRDSAEKLVGKEVAFKTATGNVINGKIASAHGNKGAVRVIFEKGMPGQSLGKNVEIKALIFYIILLTPFKWQNNS